MLPSTLKNDLLSSIVVFLVALPLCMGIAIASGVPVAAGLITGIVGGIVVGSIAGCPLQVSGPAAGLTVIVYEVVQQFGLETLGIIVLAAGALQFVAGLLGLGRWFRAVSPAVIKGMLAGIGVLIFASQFHVMVDARPKGSGIANLLAIPQSIAKAAALPEDRSEASYNFHKRLLQDVGELRRQQVNLSERVSEHFPQIRDPEAEYSQRQQETAETSLVGFAEEQRGIGKALIEVVDELEDTTGQLPDHVDTEAVTKAARIAIEQNNQAVQAFEDGDPAGVLAAQGESAVKLDELLEQLKNHHLAAYVGIATIAVILCWQFIPATIRVIPGPLVAVAVATVAAALLSLPVLYVQVPDRLWDGIHFPSSVIFTDLSVLTLIQSAILLAVVASAETLLCATAVDQMHGGTRTNYNRELTAQGVGNMICGALGALPMTGVIVRSSANVQAGGKTRAAAVFHGIWLLLFVASFGFLLRQIPTSCLAAVLVYTGVKLMNFQAVKNLAKYGWSEVGVYVATVTMIVCTDLLTGVLVGIGLAAAKLLYTFSHLSSDLSVDEQSKQAVLKLNGDATFLRLPLIAEELDRVPQGSELHVDFEKLDYIDHACLELLTDWAKQHETTGGRLVIDWQSLHARFRGGGNGNGIPDIVEREISAPSNSQA